MPSDPAIVSEPIFAPRAPGTAFASFVLGVPLLAIGAALLGWVLIMNLEPARGTEWAMWAIQRSPVPLFLTPEQAATLAIQVPVLWAMGITGALFAGCGLEEIWGARRSLRPANESHNGKARLELKSPPRLGRVAEGAFVLLKGAKVGDAYDVRLTCGRRVIQRDALGKASHFDDNKYDQRLHSKVVPSASGSLQVPFRFEIPVTMPVHRADLAADLQYNWVITVGTPKQFFPTKFPLDVRAVAVGDQLPMRDSIENGERDWTHVEPTPGEKVLFAKIEQETQISPKVLLFLVGVVGIFCLVAGVIVTINVFSNAFR